MRTASLRLRQVLLKQTFEVILSPSTTVMDESENVVSNLRDFAMSSHLLVVMATVSRSLSLSKAHCP